MTNIDVCTMVGRMVGNDAACWGAQAASYRMYKLMSLGDKPPELDVIKKRYVEIVKDALKTLKEDITNEDAQFVLIYALGVQVYSEVLATLAAGFKCLDLNLCEDSSVIHFVVV